MTVIAMTKSNINFIGTMMTVKGTLNENIKNIRIKKLKRT